MAKPFPNTTIQFDSDLDAILNRVYGSKTGSELERGPATIPPSFGHHEQGSQELKQALAELRDRREKSQSTLRLKEEVDYLQGQIKILREMGDRIERLRRQLEAEPGDGPQ
ncbi:hypothetical protein [Thiocystis violacea]|uniref:hypothetical protein n=1 Tax=Thiocystis violacea TaxID=13725 RepID=UPI001907675E|nr:hypothetical protein [Thiocystis violacea]MBK1718271.1 hypothetical protein [Thiocystis violacea]